MNTRFLNEALMGLSLVALPLLGGCTQKAAADSEAFADATNAEPALAELSSAPPVTPVEAEPALSATNEVVAPVIEAVPKLPANLSVSGPLAEVIKLTQAGVGEGVLLSFITNTTGVFSLGADEIVYLNDLGVPGDTITTMMQHDQDLRALRLSALEAHQSAPPVVAAPPALAQEEVASAPTYVTAPAMEAEPAYVSNDYFYDTLAPYGSWVYVPGYGSCWRPTVVVGNSNWQPYCNRGRWVNSNCGWYWLSDYSWGATTFHYGRWFNAPTVGWCWWPDNVWAPSWVSWRYTSDYCGWAPLPPTACYQSGFGLTYQNGAVGVGFGFGLGASSYAFVAWGNFCNPRPYQYCLPSSRAAQVYATATPVNHLEAGGRGQVYNRGIAPERVREYSRAEVRTVNIQERAGRVSRGEQLDRDGRTLAVHRPNLVSPSIEGGNNLQPTGRSAVRTGAPRGNDRVISTSPLQPVPTTPSTANRAEVRSDRTRPSAGRSMAPAASSLTPTTSTTAVTGPAVAATGRFETRPGREQRVAGETANLPRVNLPAVVRPSDMSAPSIIASAPTPSVPQPRVNQVMPQNTPRPAAPVSASSIVVIGGRNNTQPRSRDYSVWSSGTPVTAPNAPISSPRENYTVRSTPSSSVNPPQLADNTPDPVSRAQTERTLPSRNEYGRSQNRGAYSTYSAPAPSPQAPTSAKRTVPSYTPRPAPSAAPAQSRSTPSAPPTSAPTRSDSGQGRPSR